MHDRTDTLCGFILAAGEGRRLRPLTLERPKALVPLCGVPLLELVAGQLLDAGVADIGVNVCAHASAVLREVRRLNARHGWQLRTSQETRLLDTGGGLRQGARLFPNARHLLVHNVDVLLDADLRTLLDEHFRRGAAATLLLVEGCGPRTVTLRGDGCIARFRLPPGDGHYTFSGVHVLRREVLDLLPPGDGACSIVAAYEAALAAGLPVVGLPMPATTLWADLGTVPDYIRAHAAVAARPLRHHAGLTRARRNQADRHRDLVARSVRIEGAFGIVGRPCVAAGTHLYNTVIWNGAHIEQPTRLAETVLTRAPRADCATDALPREPDPRLFATLGVEPSACQVRALRRQGSGRRFCRISCGDQSWVWCAYSHARPENALHAAHAEFLARLGIAVPRVLVHLADVGEELIEDLGRQNLAGVRSAARRREHLLDVARQAARLHVFGANAARLAQVPLSSPFDATMYAWERDYFREHLLGNVLGNATLWTSAAAADTAHVHAALLAEPLALIHRDLQSANVMVANGRGPVLIDFQGMRLGCAAYDLAALLYDPYQCPPDELRREVWDAYRRAVEALGQAAPPPHLLHTAAVSRLMQALGAFGKLWLVNGLGWYRAFIRPGLTMLRAAATADAPPRDGIRELAERALAGEVP